MTDILQEASSLINGQRAQTYGPVAENFGRIAALWSSVRGQYFSKHDVAIFMILVKVARQHDLYHRDSMVDIAGYAALDAKIFDDEDAELAPYQGLSEDFWAGVDAGIVEAQEKRERDRTQKPPRVWESMEDVPDGLTVTDADGRRWCKSWGIWYLSSSEGCRWAEPFQTTVDEAERLNSPFTEVLDTEQKGSK